MAIKRSIAFSMDDLYEGFAAAVGICRLESDGLHLEFKVQDEFFGVVKSDMKTIHLPWREIERTVFKRGPFSAKLTIHLHSLAPIADIPGHSKALLVLKFKRADRDAAQDFCASASFALSEYKIHLLENEMRQLED